MKTLFKIKPHFAIVLLTCVIVLTYSCEEDRGLRVNRIGEVPPSVTNIHVEPISGGAIISYDLPQLEDLRYIKATYRLDNGIIRESKSSIYQNQLRVDGYGIEGSYEVELRSVSVGEVESAPLIVNIEALRPPYLTARDHFSATMPDIIPTFGGFNLTYQNSTRSDIIIRIIGRDQAGEWRPIETEYTNQENGLLRLRGLPPTPTDFGVYVEDRWDHRSDTLIRNLTPIAEVMLNHSSFRGMQLPNDIGFQASAGGNYASMWDGNYNWGLFGGVPNFSLPVSVTFDIIQPANLSRIQLWPRIQLRSSLYGHQHIYDFEVFGSNNPNPTGAWDNSWTSLGRFLSERPSGLGSGVAATDSEFASLVANGDTYEFTDPHQHPKYRYIRLRIYAGWSLRYSGDIAVTINEMRLFGQL